MAVPEILTELQSLGKQSNIDIFQKHGSKGSHYGVSIADLKVIQKRIKKDYQLALDLYRTGNTDAMYLAGLISDPMKMTKADLQEWADNATWHMISEYSVAWTAAESPFAIEMATKWIDSDDEMIAAAGWSTLASVVMIKQDKDLDLALFKELLHRVETTIHNSDSRVRYTMNSFVIALGGGVISLKDEAIAVANKIGKVSVNVGNTACKVPDAAAYIQKMDDKGYIGKKKKTAKC